MKLQVDGARCSGHGMCHAYASDVFELDDEGFVVAPEAGIDVPDERAKDARVGAMSCPEQAIAVLEA